MREELKISRNDGTEFEVVENSNGRYSIDIITPYCRTVAMLYEEPFLWEQLNYFNTRIEAYTFMKKNLNNLI